jgi:hypothetical protein
MRETLNWLPTRAERARLVHDAARWLASKAAPETPRDVMWKRGRP